MRNNQLVSQREIELKDDDFLVSRTEQQVTSLQQSFQHGGN